MSKHSRDGSFFLQELRHVECCYYRIVVNVTTITVRVKQMFACAQIFLVLYKMPSLTGLSYETITNRILLKTQAINSLVAFQYFKNTPHAQHTHTNFQSQHEVHHHASRHHCCRHRHPRHQRQWHTPHRRSHGHGDRDRAAWSQLEQSSSPSLSWLSHLRQRQVPLWSEGRAAHHCEPGDGRNRLREQS